MQPTRPTDIESRLQAAAERIEATPELPPEDVDAYREVYRAIRDAPMPAIAPDFARSMERLIRDHEEQAAPEVWIMRVSIFGVLAGIAASPPAWVGIGVAFSRAAESLPWSTVLAAGLALTVAAMVDKAWAAARG